MFQLWFNYDLTMICHYVATMIYLFFDNGPKLQICCYDLVSVERWSARSWRGNTWEVNNNWYRVRIFTKVCSGFQYWAWLLPPINPHLLPLTLSWPKEIVCNTYWPALTNHDNYVSLGAYVHWTNYKYNLESLMINNRAYTVCLHYVFD